jgi:hypothetical protein
MTGTLPETSNTSRRVISLAAFAGFPALLMIW